MWAAEPVPAFAGRNRWLAALLLLGALLSSGTLHASAEDLFGGELGRWLNSSAVPELAQRLKSHPRFRGETIRLVSLLDGRPTEQSDGLTAAIRQHLTHSLLRAGGVRIAWLPRARTCDVTTPDASLLLGVSVSRQGRQHQVRLAMIDVEESIWIPGVNLEWRGLLSSAERAALNTPQSDDPPGAPGRPMPLARHAALADELVRRMHCALPAPLDGDVVLDTGDAEPSLLRLEAALRQRLDSSARLRLAADNASAEWRLKLTLRELPGVGHELEASLLPLDNGTASGSQRLAALFVQHSPGGSAVAAAATATTTTTAAQLPGRSVAEPAARAGVASARPGYPPRLIDRLQPVSGREAHCGPDCLQVELRLREPAYAVVAQTRMDGTMALANCATPPRRAEDTRRFRVRQRHNTLSLYAISTRDRRVARAVHRALSPGGCSGDAADRWLPVAQDVFDAFAEDIDWRVLELAPALHADAGGR